MSGWRIFHNPRCSKSRAALQSLQENDIDPEVVLYLATPPTLAELRQLLEMAKLRPRELVRTKEKRYRELDVDWDDDEAALAALQSNPVLLERPIVVHGEIAVVARSPERLNELLDGA